MTNPYEAPGSASIPAEDSSAAEWWSRALGGLVALGASIWGIGGAAAGYFYVATWEQVGHHFLGLSFFGVFGAYCWVRASRDFSRGRSSRWLWFVAPFVVGVGLKALQFIAFLGGSL